MISLEALEIFTLLTGVAYIVLEIRQKNMMWAVGMFTGLAAMWVFFSHGLYASSVLNAYYFFMSFWGLWQWRRTKGLMRKRAGGAYEGDVICLDRLSWPVAAVSLVLAVAGTFAIAALMERSGNPMSYMDSAVAVLSALATWWLGKSYLEQWYIWIAADCISAFLCASQGLWWMTALYAFYTMAAAYGLIHWKRYGKYPDSL